MSTIESLSFSDIFVGGDLSQRIERNFDRLESSIYRSPDIFKPNDGEWPGDYEGRTILALVLLAQASHRPPLYLSEIMRHLADHVNPQGYFGSIRTMGSVDEQQLAGNSWVLRAMVEHYRWKHDSLSRQIIQTIVENLLVPIGGLFSVYPSDERPMIEGGPAGQLLDQHRGAWSLSTDIGCAFIMLDGATAAYSILPSPRLKRVIEEMVRRFAELDPQVLSMQTHATLSAARGITRYYEIDGNASLLSVVERTYQLYTRNAMTANYANYNWFGRPRWTEACAVIDSFILATELWKHTRRAQYLDDAHKIYFNAMCHAQRPNGGFGCDSCVGAPGNNLEPLSSAAFEASWCCTMRGGEGLARAAQYIWLVEADKIILGFYHNGIARILMGADHITIRQVTRYPVQGAIRLEILDTSVVEDTTLSLYIPEWVDNHQVCLTIHGVRQTAQVTDHFVAVTKRFQPGDIVELAFPIPLRRVESVANSENSYSLWHGTLMLGAESRSQEVTLSPSETFTPLENAFYRMKESHRLLSPLTDLYLTTTETAVTDRRQVLFPSTEMHSR